MNNSLWLGAALLASTMMPLCSQTARGLALDAPAAGDFFIISSVDLAKRQLLLKLPTEVTELMRVESATRIFDERGAAIKLSDLRAGDTVYVISSGGGDRPVASAIRKGPMTVELLRQRYLSRKK